MTCRCASTHHTGFDGIEFGIEADPRSGVYRDWDGMEPIYVDEHVPYSNLWTSELIGHTPAVVTWRLVFHCRHRYEAFLARMGRVGTLTVLAGYQSLKGEPVTLGNPARAYERLDNVKLRAIPVREHHVGGMIEVEATFERAVDPVTREALVP